MNKVISLYKDLGIRARVYIWFRVMLTIFKEIERVVPKEGKIVELGCGVGLFANLLSVTSEKREVVGIDLSPQRIRVASSSVGDRKNIRFLTKDIKDFHPDGCDVIVCYDIMHHVNFNQQAEILKRCFEGLKPDGLLIIKDNSMKPKWKFYLNYLHELITCYTQITKGDRLSFRSPAEFKDILEDIGFTVKTRDLRTWLPYPFVLIIAKK